jgi:putative ABC transport system permease protein
MAGFKRTIAESFRISLMVIVLFAVVIAVGVVYNGIRVALSERGRELASLRVLGFTVGEVRRLLLGEQAILTLLAVPVGWLVGLGFAALITARVQSDLFRMPLVVLPRTYLLAALVVVAAAAASGLLVARRLGRMDLVAVLKARE